MEDKFEFSKSELGLKTQIFNEGGYASAPFAFVEPFFTKLDSRNDTRNDTRNIEPPDDMYNALCVSGLTINGVTCKVKMRRPSKRERQEKGRAKEGKEGRQSDSARRFAHHIYNPIITLRFALLCFALLCFALLCFTHRSC